MSKEKAIGGATSADCNTGPQSIRLLFCRKELQNKMCWRVGISDNFVGFWSKGLKAPKGQKPTRRTKNCRKGDRLHSK